MRAMIYLSHGIILTINLEQTSWCSIYDKLTEVLEGKISLLLLMINEVSMQQRLRLTLGVMTVCRGRTENSPT